MDEVDVGLPVAGSDQGKSADLIRRKSGALDQTGRERIMRRREHERAMLLQNRVPGLGAAHLFHAAQAEAGAGRGQPQPYAPRSAFEKSSARLSNWRCS